MGSHHLVREAPLSLAQYPWPWRLTRVRLSEAARLAGVSRSSLYRALSKHRLSCNTDKEGRQWIDVSEIARVYPDKFRSVPQNVPRHTMQQLVETAVQRELRERLSDKDALIADLRRRLDAEAEERRQLLVILTDIRGLLEDRTQAAAISKPSPWWRLWWR
jgi:hypothetical protein